MKIGRIILILFLVICVISVAAYWATTRIFIPRMITNSLENKDSLPAFPIIILPQQVQEKLTPAIMEVNKKIDKIPYYMDSLDLEFEDLLEIVDEVQPSEVFELIDELNSTELTSLDQVFDIGAKHVHIRNLDPEQFRQPFLNYMTMRRVRKALKIINENKLTTTLSVPMARETAKQILLDKRERIENKLEEIKQDAARRDADQIAP